MKTIHFLHDALNLLRPDKVFVKGPQHNAAQSRENGDMVFMGAHTDYRGILQKTFLLLQHAVASYDVAFILKTDDDAFVNPPWLSHVLRSMSDHPPPLPPHTHTLVSLVLAKILQPSIYARGHLAPQRIQAY